MTAMSAAPSGGTSRWYQRGRPPGKQQSLPSGARGRARSLLWDYIISPATKTYPFTLSSPASLGMAHLTVDFQGGTDFDASPDHHVRVSVNGAFVAEASWDAARPRRRIVIPWTSAAADYAPRVLCSSFPTLTGIASHLRAASQGT